MHEYGYPAHYFTFVMLTEVGTCSCVLVIIGQMRWHGGSSLRKTEIMGPVHDDKNLMRLITYHRFQWLQCRMIDV